MKKQLARLACLSLLAAACSAEPPLATSGPATDRMSVIPNVKGQWTYFSMVTHTVVGTCAVTDTLAQQAYAARTDWDIAIADSGTSGPGDGGIAPSPYDYEHTEPDMPAIFQTDSIR